MIKQSRVTSKFAVSLLAVATSMVGISSVCAATDIRFGDEDVATGTFQVSNKVTTFNLSAPFICADVGTPTTQFQLSKINPVFPGAIPAKGSFQFGALSAGTQVGVGGLGSWSFVPSEGLVIPQSDPALVCYALSATGTRKASSGLFSDTFDLPQGDAAVTIRTVQLPDANNGFYYKYYVDVTIPVVSTVSTIPFVIRDGFDSSVFAASTNGSGFYCDTTIGSSTCSGTAQFSNLDVLVQLPPNTAYSKRFIVSRPLRNDVLTLPATNQPLVLAAVFSLGDLDTKLDNNVAGGYGAVSDFLPTIDTTATNLSGLVEGGSSLLNVGFAISDDTNESVGQLLNAAVSLDFNGTVVAAPNVNCGSTSPQAGPGASRSCSFDVVLPNSDFATDKSNGVYAGGVYANVIINATDARGQVSTKILPLHVASSDNDPPVFDLSELAPIDSGNNLPTLTCSLAESSSLQCMGVIADFISNMAPGPVNAVDELAMQGTYVATLSGQRLSCNSTDIFALNGEPRYIIGGGHVDLDYSLKGTLGSTHCVATVGDSGTVYPGQTFTGTNKQFRIVVTN